MITKYILKVRHGEEISRFETIEEVAEFLRYHKVAILEALGMPSNFTALAIKNGVQITENETEITCIITIGDKQREEYLILQERNIDSSDMLNYYLNL